MILLCGVKFYLFLPFSHCGQVDFCFLGLFCGFGGVLWVVLVSTALEMLGFCCPNSLLIECNIL